MQQRTFFAAAGLLKITKSVLALEGVADDDDGPV
jgi:hypothetical protein